jgi:hypothetical protein
MPDDIEEISHRINELGAKSSQVLLFLSFAMVSVAILETIKDAPVTALNNALWWWKCALLPILVSIVPLKEVRWKVLAWYKFIQWMRIGLIWWAVILIAGGVVSFFRA